VPVTTLVAFPFTQVMLTVVAGDLEDVGADTGAEVGDADGDGEGVGTF